MTLREHLRQTFDAEAALYHKARPRYPEDLFDRLVGVTGLEPNSKLLEIGPGTGIATEPLARRGYHIIGVELGPEMAAEARRNLSAYPKTRIENVAFEEFDALPGSFDLIYSATAFHWIDPKVNFEKPFSLLNQDGHLAIIHCEHVSDEKGDDFFSASQPIYQKYDHGHNPTDEAKLLPTSGIPPSEIDEKLFEFVAYEAFPVINHYSAYEFCELLTTYSPTLAMDNDTRTGFLTSMRELIEEKFNGIVEKHFAMTLLVAQRKQ